MGKARSGSKRAQPATPEQDELEDNVLSSEDNEIVSLLPSERKKLKSCSAKTDGASFVGKPIPAEEARSKWPRRYSKKEWVLILFLYFYLLNSFFL